MSSTTRDVISLLDKQLKLIDDVMDNFNFHKVHRVMKFLHWTWAFTDNGVPEEYELRSLARKYLHEVLSGVLSGRAECSVCSGGFAARARRYDPEESKDEPIIQLSLVFELEDWSIDTEEINGN